MCQVNSPELVAAVEKAKAEMMKSSQLAGTAGRWDDAQFRLQCARDLDAMLLGIRQNGDVPAPARPPTAVTHTPKPTPTKRHYFIDGNKLAKIGPSRDGSTYRHNVTREHYDEMVAQLIAISRETQSFETGEFTAHLDIPKHEPLIFLAALEEQKLLNNPRRGRWVFVSAETFEADVQKVWGALPRQ
jgi:hypothetical protein